MQPMTSIRPKTRDTVINALRSGVVPSLGLHYIHVGREKELRALTSDLQTVADGGSAYKFIVGPVGVGKTEMTQMLASIARDLNLVTAKVDLDARCRLYGKGGEAAEFYKRLTANLAIKSQPEGNALATVLERFIVRAEDEAASTGRDIDDVIDSLLKPLSGFVCGYELRDALRAYRSAHLGGQDEVKMDVVRRLRGEFATKTDAKRALDLRTIPNDTNMYAFVKMLAALCRIAGYGGLVVFVDEAAALCGIANAGARQRNYEMVLTVINDLLQNAVAGVGIVFAGTPDLIDPKKGLHSVEALKTRIAGNPLATAGNADFASPTVMLSPLTNTELKVLLLQVQNVYAFGDESRYTLTSEDVTFYLESQFRKLGGDLLKRTRDVVSALHLSTLVQQLLSLVAQMSGVTETEAFTILGSSRGPFSRTTDAEFRRLITHLIETDVLYRSGGGLLLLGARGERLVASQSFFAALASSVDYSVFAENRLLGSLPLTDAVEVGAGLVFAGRRWRIRRIDDERKKIYLDRGEESDAAQFLGSAITVHHEVRGEMLRIYLSDATPAYLDEPAVALLQEGRESFSKLGLVTQRLVAVNTDTLIFPWVGDRAMNTMRLQLLARGFAAKKTALTLHLRKCSPTQLKEILPVLQADATPAEELAARVRKAQVHKHHGRLPSDLCALDYASEFIDVAAAAQAWTAIAEMKE